MEILSKRTSKPKSKSKSLLNKSSLDLEANKCSDTCHECMKTSNECINKMLKGADVKKMADCIKTCIECVFFCQCCSQISSLKGNMLRECCISCMKACRKCINECKKYKYNKYCKKCVEACEKCLKQCETVISIYDNKTTWTTCAIPVKVHFDYDENSRMNKYVVVDSNCPKRVSGYLNDLSYYN